MRTRFLLALCLASMPMCLTGCDSSGDTTVGTGQGQMPADVKKRLEEQENNYKKAQEAQAKNTPAPGE